MQVEKPKPEDDGLRHRLCYIRGMDYLHILLLAVIQGACELLPVSSSAHVIFAMKWMGRDPSSPQMTFLLIMLHTGTMGAVIVYFWRSWMNLLFVTPDSPATPRRAINWHIVMMVFWATLVTGVLGLGLKFLIERVILERMLGHTDAEVEHLFRNLPLIAASLFSVGVVIIAAGLLEGRAGHDRITLGDSIWIGLIQGLCLPFRGFSRSGATISMGLFRGVSRRLSEEFSFILVVVLTPPVIARGVWRLLRDQETMSASQLFEIFWPGLIGMVFSFLAGLAALKLLSAVLEGGRWRYFGYYCLFAAGVLWLTTAMGWLP